MPSLMAMLGLNLSAFKAGLDQSVELAKKAGGKIRHFINAELGGDFAKITTFEGLKHTAEQTIEYGERVADLAKKYGMSTDAVQAWDYALKQNGSSIEAAGGMFGKLAASRDKALHGDEKAIAAYKKLGVSIDDLKSKRLEDLGEQIAQAFEHGDPQALINDLRTVGGKGAGAMVAAFRTGFTDLLHEAKGAGVIIDHEVILKLKHAGDSLRTVGAQFKAGIAPAVAWLADSLKKIWHDSNVLMRGAVGFVTGGKAGAKELMAEYDEASKEAERLAKAREEKPYENPEGADLDEEEGAKAKREKEQEAKRALELQKQLEDLQARNYDASLDKEAKITELHRRRVELAQWLAENYSKLSETGRLEAQIDVEKLAGEEAAAERSQEKQGKIKISNNSLQQIGAYAAAPSLEAVALDVHKKNEGHLAGIYRTLQEMKANKRGGVDF